MVSVQTLGQTPEYRLVDALDDWLPLSAVSVAVLLEVALRSHVADVFVTVAQYVNEQPGAEQFIDDGVCAIVQPSEPVASALAMEMPASATVALACSTVVGSPN